MTTLPPSVRPDGTVRRPVRIRPGHRSQEIDRTLPAVTPVDCLPAQSSGGTPSNGYSRAYDVRMRRMELQLSVNDSDSDDVSLSQESTLVEPGTHQLAPSPTRKPTVLRTRLEPASKDMVWKQVHAVLLDFIGHPVADRLVFSTDLTAFQRRAVHVVAEAMGLTHRSTGEYPLRRIIVDKAPGTIESALAKDSVTTELAYHPSEQQHTHSHFCATLLVALPLEILYSCIAFLDGPSLSQLSCVSRLWLSIGVDEHNWRILYNRDFPRTFTEVQQQMRPRSFVGDALIGIKDTHCATGTASETEPSTAPATDNNVEDDEKGGVVGATTVSSSLCSTWRTEYIQAWKRRTQYLARRQRASGKERERRNQQRKKNKVTRRMKTKVGRQKQKGLEQTCARCGTAFEPWSLADGTPQAQMQQQQNCVYHRGAFRHDRRCPCECHGTALAGQRGRRKGKRGAVAAAAAAGYAGGSAGLVCGDCLGQWQCCSQEGVHAAGCTVGRHIGEHFTIVSQWKDYFVENQK